MMPKNIIGNAESHDSLQAIIFSSLNHYTVGCKQCFSVYENQQLLIAIKTTYFQTYFPICHNITPILVIHAFTKVSATQCASMSEPQSNKFNFVSIT